MRMVMIASEGAPYLIHALSKALIKLGYTVYVIMPKYAKLKRSLERKVKEGIKVYIDYQWREFDLYEDILDHVRYFFIDYKPYYGRGHVYALPREDYHNNALRFGFLLMASLQVIRELELKPDVIHIHNWRTEILPLYKSFYYPDLEELSVVFTIHDAGPFLGKDCQKIRICIHHHKGAEVL
ncbi:MAG: glycogen/starch synthase [Thermocrinis sp.]|nr:glycogen/starch synthase [Thermocrinis sp.]